MDKKLYLLTLFALLTLCGNSQTVAWQMQPTDYNQIERVSSTLFKVVRNGKIGLINPDGTIVAPVVNDNISDYYEHKALITSNDGHGERITGCLTDDGIYYGYAIKYYTLNGQKFFSDGLISVADENGKLGYIDERGNQIAGFDGKYSRIKPFTEGYATVMKNKKYVLIDKDGDEMRFVYSKGVGAAIAGCTNVYNGKAYVYDEYGGNDRSYFIYDALTKSDLVKTGRVKNTAMDYLYCYQSVSGRTKEVPFEKMKPYSGSKGLAASQSNGMYGYMSGGSTIVPCQFSSASQFEDGLAIVNINGQLGILKFVDGASFDVTTPTVKHDFYADNSVSCSFNLSIPSTWQGKSIDVILKDINGSAISTTKNSDTYTFSVKPTASGQQEYTVIVYGEGILLYKSKIIYTFNMKELCVTCGKDKTQCAYHGNHPTHIKEQKAIKEKECPTCGKKISECKYQGVH